MLILLGFAATSWVITITLSAADATAHIIENPFVPRAMNRPVAVTLVLLGALSAIFLKGFKEAIGLAVALVAVYLALNVVVVGWGLCTRASDSPIWCSDWLDGASPRVQQPGTRAARRGDPVSAAWRSGLSGFETGVAVMPLVEGGSSDPTQAIEGRIRNTKKLLRLGRAHHERAC